MKGKKLLRRSLIAITVTGLCFSIPAFADDDDDDYRDGDHKNGTVISFIHSGDFHGDYHPHTNGRGDAAGMLEGGLARAATVIKNIRSKNSNVIHVHTGDTIHGSGEASITKGMALVRMVDQLGIDVSTPGNWEWAYTPYRYMQFFGVHDGSGNNMDIIADADFDTSVYKSVKYKVGSPYPEDNIGDVPSFGKQFREVKYVASYDSNGKPVMATGYNRWGMVAANSYQNGTWKLDHGVQAKETGMNLTPPYRIIEKDGVKIGFIGCTTNRGPQVVSSTITTGVSFSNCKGEIKFPQNRPIDWDDASYSHGGTKASPGGKWKGNPASAETQAGNRDVAGEQPVVAGATTPQGWDNFPHWGGNWGYKVQNEIVKWTNYLRKVEKVDLVAVMSEAGIAENIYAAENLTDMTDGPDIYFSSDMHEETNYPVVVTDPNGKKVIVIENPEDANQISQLNVVVDNGKIKSWTFKGIDVNETIAEDIAMKDLIAQIDMEIADKISNGAASNPYSGHVINYQLNDVVGETDDMQLERNRFTTEYNPGKLKMPAVIEGTGHALITDMFRKFTKADVGGLRGFRYTNSVLDGQNITYKSLYHFFPIGAQVAVGSIPTTPLSEKAPDLSGTDSDGDGCADADSNCNGIVLTDQADNKRHFVGFPRSLQQEMELAGNSTMNPIVPNWGGGWFWNYSGVKFNLKPSGSNFNKYGTKTSARVSNITYYDNQNGKTDGEAMSDALGSMVKYASYYYPEDYNRINRNQLITKGFCAKKGFGGLSRDCVDAKSDIRILTKQAGTGDYVLVKTSEYFAHVAEHGWGGDGQLQVLDAVEALGRYISDRRIRIYNWDGGAKNLSHTVDGLDEEVEGDDFVYPRVTLIKADNTEGNDLTDCTAEFGSPCIEPFRGSEAALAAGNVTLPAGYIKGTADTPASSGSF